MKDFFSNLLNLNTIGYDYERVRKEIHAEPMSPAVVISIYFVTSLVIVSFLVIGCAYCEADGDMSRVFKDDEELNRSSSAMPSYSRQVSYGDSAAIRAQRSEMIKKQIKERLLESKDRRTNIV